jgi:hypothetical protein
MRLLDIVEIAAAKRLPFAKITNAVNQRLQAELEKFDNQEISKKTFVGRAKKILGAGYKKAYLQGSGLSRLDTHGLDWIKSFSDKQFSFLESFADDIAAGTGKMEYDTRIGLYAKAIQSAYWGGSAAESPVGVLLNWVLTANESCQDCLDNAAGSPYLPDELPGVPGDGQTKCGSNCKCFILQVKQ